MSDATQSEGENDPAAPQRERERRNQDANREKRRQRQRAWRKANPDKVKAQQARSRPTIEKYRDEHREKILEQKRIAERRRTERVKKENAARARAAERARQYDAAHPEHARDRERRYRETHREQIRQRQREYYARNKEQIKERNAERAHADPRYQEFQRRYREANREKIKERQRIHRADPEVYERALEYNRQWRQRERRRLQAGLPRIQPHRTGRSEKVVNAAASAAFFTRQLGEDEQRRIVAELDQLRDEKERAWKIAQRRRTERIVRAGELGARVDEYLARRGRRLREEVRLDSRARELRGAKPYPDLEAEARRRATEALVELSRRRVRESASAGTPLGRSWRIRPNTASIISAPRPTKGWRGI